MTAAPAIPSTVGTLRELKASPLPTIVSPNGGPGISPADLGQLIEAFNDVTGRLVKTHEDLQSQVLQLKTELEAANEQVERSRRLAALGEMAAGISHEVRNPLGSILLYARMLQQDLAKQPPSRTIADKIVGAVQRLDAVVGDVLAFSREMRLRPVELDAREALESALEASRGPGPEWDGLEVAGPSGNQTIHADPGLLQQALINLIRNAVQAMAGEDTDPTAALRRPRRLELEVAQSELRLESGSVKPMVALRVLDSGPGVPEAMAERLFNPFFTTRAAGTGLGLAIVHRIIDAHGGRISLRNRTNATGRVTGAAVEIMLPCPAAVPTPVTA